VSDKKEPIVTEAQRTVRSHQRDRDVFRSVISVEIDWRPIAAFPPSVRTGDADLDNTWMIDHFLELFDRESAPDGSRFWKMPK
jgi:hypothetical protein